MNIKTRIAAYRAAVQIKDGNAACRRGDYVTAFQLMQPLAVKGDATAQYNLGLLYLRGHGVPQDFNVALKWFRHSAAQSEAGAQNSLGTMYADGHGVTQDYIEALKWYRLAAAQGYATAQSNLGVMYLNGHGVTPDYVEALKWYRLAAAQGHATAQYNLGAMYAIGYGVPQDYVEALKWSRLAAAQGYTIAQENLGILYRRVESEQMRAQLEKMKLTEAERHMIAEAEAKGEEFTLNDLDVLRTLNFGNPRYGRPSKERLREMQLTPQEMMWEITGEAQYKPLSERMGFKLANMAIAVVVWIGLPLVGVVFFARWLQS